MKTVTITNWDGSKYKVKAPSRAKYIGILSHTGCINFYAKKPKLSGAGGYYDASLRINKGLYGVCPDANLPCEDGYGCRGPASELLLKIVEE